MFQMTICQSSGETTVSMRHLEFVILCGWLSGMQGPQTLHTRQSYTQSDKYHVSHRYSCFSWWWAHSHPKHVEKRYKHTKKNCTPSWLYLQDYKRMYGQLDIKILQSTKLYPDSVQRRVSHMGDSIPSNTKINNCLLNIFTTKRHIFPCIEREDLHLK